MRSQCRQTKIEQILQPNKVNYTKPMNVELQASTRLVSILLISVLQLLSISRTAEGLSRGGSLLVTPSSRRQWHGGRRCCCSCMSHRLMRRAEMCKMLRAIKDRPTPAQGCASPMTRHYF